LQLVELGLGEIRLGVNDVELDASPNVETGFGQPETLA
jgi:hypothetical protein